MFLRRHPSVASGTPSYGAAVHQPLAQLRHAERLRVLLPRQAAPSVPWPRHCCNREQVLIKAWTRSTLAGLEPRRTALAEIRNRRPERGCRGTLRAPTTPRGPVPAAPRAGGRCWEPGGRQGRRDPSPCSSPCLCFLRGLSLPERGSYLGESYLHVRKAGQTRKDNH